MLKRVEVLTEEQLDNLPEDPDGSLEVAVDAPAEEVEPEQVPDPNKLRPIQMELAGLIPGLPFPIYFKSDSSNAFSLLLPKGGQLNDTHRRKIRNQSGGIVYIQSKDYPLYATEAEQTVDRILSDDGKDVQEKVPVFFSYATERLEEVFRRVSEEGGKKATLVLPLAGQALGLIQQDWKAAFSLLRLAQKHPRTYAHSLNVCLFGLSYVHNYISIYSEYELKEIAFGFLSHDIGELLVSKELLEKKSQLTLIERKIVQQIPLHGHKVLTEAGCGYQPAVEIVLNHHERVDGTGYPRGLANERIPLLARVCAVCEAFDTLTTPQSYRRETYNASEAIDRMLKDDPGHFDQRVLIDFIRMIGGEPRQ